MKKKNFFEFLRHFLGLKKKKVNTNGYLTGKQWQSLKTRLEELMDQRKPFLKPGYSINDLAKDVELPAYQLSAFINQVLGMNFSDYINNSRIRYCEQLIKRSFNTRVNVKDLAHLCGFNNRNSFTTAFKKFTGRTPSGYVKYH